MYPIFVYIYIFLYLYPSFLEYVWIELKTSGFCLWGERAIPSWRRKQVCWQQWKAFGDARTSLPGWFATRHHWKSLLKQKLRCFDQSDGHLGWVWFRWHFGRMEHQTNVLKLREGTYRFCIYSSTRTFTSSTGNSQGFQNRCFIC